MSAQVEFACPRCGHRCDAATAIDDPEVKPEAGDVGLCIACAAPLTYDAERAPRWMTYEECKALPPTIRAQVTAAAFLIATCRPTLVRSVRA